MPGNGWPAPARPCDGHNGSSEMIEGARKAPFSSQLQLTTQTS